MTLKQTVFVLAFIAIASILFWGGILWVGVKIVKAAW